MYVRRFFCPQLCYGKEVTEMSTCTAPNGANFPEPFTAVFHIPPELFRIHRKKYYTKSCFPRQLLLGNLGPVICKYFCAILKLSEDDIRIVPFVFMIQQLQHTQFYIQLNCYCGLCSGFGIPVVSGCDTSHA